MTKESVTKVENMEWLDGHYTGDINDGVPHGQGELDRNVPVEYREGVKGSGDDEAGESERDEYFGQVHLGFGYEPDQYPYTWSDCAKYVGRFKRGHPDGEGNFTLVDGSIYVGQLKDGKWHGKGTWTHPDGDECSGQWKEGRLHGQASWKQDGDEYVGEWKDGLRHGKGTFTCDWGGEDWGNKYVGDWKDDSQRGHGIITYPTGFYEGEVTGGPTPNGFGTYTHYGSIYIGEFYDGVPDGHGTLTHSDGGEYTGEFRSGRCQGPIVRSKEDPDKPIYFQVQDLRIGIEYLDIRIAICDVEVFPFNGSGSPHPSVLRPKLWEHASLLTTVGGGAIFYYAHTSDPNDILYLLPRGCWNIYEAGDIDGNDYYLIVESEIPGIDYSQEREGIRVDDDSDLPNIIDKYAASWIGGPNFSQATGRIEFEDIDFYSLHEDIDFYSLYYEVVKHFGRGKNPDTEAVYGFLDEMYGSRLMNKRIATMLFFKALGEKQGTAAFNKYAEELERQSEEAGPGPVRAQIHDFLTMGNSSMPLESIIEAIETFSEGVKTEK
jgi:hypothetical protein